MRGSGARIALVAVTASACGRPDAPVEPPPSAAPAGLATPLAGALPPCPEDEIAYRRAELPVDALIAREPSDPADPWSALPAGSSATPWIDTRHGLLVVPRPAATAQGPARWDVVSSRTGTRVQSFEVADPDALPSEVARWLQGHRLFDGADEAPLRAIEVPPAGSRQLRVDERTGWSTFSGPAAHGDADIDPFFRLEIPDRCRWTVGVGDEAFSRLDDGLEIGWSLHTTSLWIAPEAMVAVLAVVYRGQVYDASGQPTSTPRSALAYRVLGGAR